MRLKFTRGHGWRRIERRPVTLWANGYLFNIGLEALADKLAALGSPPDAGDIAPLVKELDGHFALAAAYAGKAEADSWVLAVTDRVRSIPLFFGKAGELDGGWILGSHGAGVARELGPARGKVEPDSVRAIAMAGYTTGTATLYSGLKQLGHGEFLLHRPEDVEPTRHVYYRYRPWRADRADDNTLRRDLEDVTLRILDKLARDADGRPIVVPLSAGLDSRLIAAGLRHLGYQNVHCFAYGRAGNHEMKTSKEIAEKLGYPWTFIPFTNFSQRKFFNSSMQNEFESFADNCDAVPFFQDLPAVAALSSQGWLPDEALLVNGNSGDYLTGHHIPAPLRRPTPDAGPDERQEKVLDALIARHFSLWEYLMTPENCGAIKTRLRDELEAVGALSAAPETDHGLFEYCEFQDRQSKYVIAGQRAYEFLNLEWRLPLWDRDYLDFWERAPLSGKAEQILYRRMLKDLNWGDVWRDIPVNRLRVRPAWMVPIRLLAKTLYAPLGREKWHRFEKRYLAYHTDTLCAYADLPYARIRRDRRGFRNVFSWRAENYLANKGLTGQEKA